MSVNKVTDGGAQVGRLVFGGPGAVGGRLTGVLTGTVNATPGTIAAGARGTLSLTITGVRAGDVVYLEPHASITAGLVLAAVRVSANDTVQADVVNATAGSITDSTARAWGYTVIRTS